MPDNKNLTQPLITLMLLMAANTNDPTGKLNNLGHAVTSMREALININSGLEAFHTQVIPMLMRPPEKK